jgi:wyosine [tRNA(Phe)-imidazoG37] synthetase (radical SAM superfamily)
VRESRASGGMMIAFGPVPSRRLGRSLGINNIPPKVCSYSCAYCQLGRTARMRIERGPVYGARRVLAAVRERVEQLRASGEAVDYLTFVSDGEPTLDVGLGRAIRRLKALGVPVAVISNSSLLWRADVRDELAGAAWVSLKVDSIREDVWRRLDRPHRRLRLDAILEGVRVFARTFAGTLVTETMLVRGANDGDEHLVQVGSYLAELRPATAYLSIPHRPPAETWAQPPDEPTLANAWHVFAQRLPRVECLTGYEGDAFATEADVEHGLLSIASVHPMREEAVRAYVERAGCGWAAVARLMAQGDLIEVEHAGHRFYLRRFATRGTAPGGSPETGSGAHADGYIGSN